MLSVSQFLAVTVGYLFVQFFLVAVALMMNHVNAFRYARRINAAMKVMQYLLLGYGVLVIYFFVGLVWIK